MAVLTAPAVRAGALYEAQLVVVGGVSGDETFVGGSALQGGTTWVRTSRGEFTSVRWRLDGVKETFYWDNFCGGDPGCFYLGHILDPLEGDYTITPPATTFRGYWASLTFIHPSLVKIDFFREPDFDICSGPPFQGDCSRRYWPEVEIDFTVAAADGPIRFGIFDTLSPIPEPATWLTLFAGFVIVGAMGRRRQSAISSTCLENHILP